MGLAFGQGSVGWFFCPRWCQLESSVCLHLPGGSDGKPRWPLILQGLSAWGLSSLSGPACTSSQHGSWASRRESSSSSPLKISEVPEHHFHHSLLIKASPKASPHSRRGEKNSTSYYEEWQVHTSVRGGDGVVGDQFWRLSFPTHNFR